MATLSANSRKNISTAPLLCPESPIKESVTEEIENIYMQDEKSIDVSMQIDGTKNHDPLSLKITETYQNISDLESLELEDDFKDCSSVIVENEVDETTKCSELLAEIKKILEPPTELHSTLDDCSVDDQIESHNIDASKSRFPGSLSGNIYLLDFFGHFQY